jgi:tripartite-type tricarboxylate transporter receptor subunit TctC
MMRHWTGRDSLAALVAGALASMTAVTEVAAVDPLTDFYTGKTLKVLVGFGPGGGYDLYARTLARYMVRHMPGHPAIIVQNLPGAGSMKSANYIYNVAPKDGTVFGTFARGVPMEPLLGDGNGVEFDATKFNWIGSIATDVTVCAFNATSSIRNWQDMQTKSYIIGSSGPGADSHLMPVVLKNMFNLPFKLIAGYQGGGADMVLAMERKEIDGRCGWSWTSLLSQHKRLYDNKQIDVVLQLAIEKHEDLPNVPLVFELTSDPIKIAALKLILSGQFMARPFAAPPEVPAERVKALRDAFDATVKDPEFIAEAVKADLEVHPVSGDQIAQLLRDVYASPKDVIQLARSVSKDPAK